MKEKLREIAINTVQYLATKEVEHLNNKDYTEIEENCEYHSGDCKADCGVECYTQEKYDILKDYFEVLSTDREYFDSLSLDKIVKMASREQINFEDEEGINHFIENILNAEMGQVFYDLLEEHKDLMFDNYFKGLFPVGGTKNTMLLNDFTSAYMMRDNPKWMLSVMVRRCTEVWDGYDSKKSLGKAFTAQTNTIDSKDKDLEDKDKTISNARTKIKELESELLKLRQIEVKPTGQATINILSDENKALKTQAKKLIRENKILRYESK